MARWLGRAARLPRRGHGDHGDRSVLIPPNLGGPCSSNRTKMDCLDPATISIVLVEDDRRIREGLRVLLDGTSGFSCINAWRSMEEALAHHWNQVPAVALV